MSENPVLSTKERIRERAYEIYLARGCQPGQELDDWLTAKREPKGLSEEQSASGAILNTANAVF